MLIVGERRPEEETERRTSPSEQVEAEPAPEPSDEDDGISGAFFAGIALAVLAVVVGLSRARRATVPDLEDDEDLDDADDPPAAPLRQAADVSLDALLGERDPRRAVVAAYVRVQALFAGGGLPRRTSETEREYLARVLGHYGAAAEPARRLTELFEAARYGVAPVDEDMRSQAIAAAHALRDGATARAGTP
jgi:hypothetical protein